MIARVGESTVSSSDDRSSSEVVEAEPASTGSGQPDSLVVEAHPIRPAAGGRDAELVEAEPLPSQNDGPGAVVREAVPRRTADQRQAPGATGKTPAPPRATMVPERQSEVPQPAPTALPTPHPDRPSFRGSQGQAPEPVRRVRAVPRALIALLALALIAAVVAGYAIASRAAAPSHRQSRSAAAPARLPAPSQHANLPVRPRPAAKPVRPRGFARSIQPSLRSNGAARTNPAASSAIWRFPGLTIHPSQVILTVTNPNSRPVGVRISFARRGRSADVHLRLPPRTGQEVGLAPRAGAGRLGVRAPLPIRVLRLVITDGHVRLSYGTAGPGGQRPADGAGRTRGK
jgi:hypothetical protein